ncbi:MAG: RNA-binding protein [Acutalibacteraceae bacterium]
MELKKGAVVISKAGHDKGDFQVVIDFDDKYAYVCDGKYRPLERLKKKKLIHLKFTNTVLDENLIKTNKAIRGALKPFLKL